MCQVCKDLVDYFMLVAYTNRFVFVELGGLDLEVCIVKVARGSMRC